MVRRYPSVCRPPGCLRRVVSLKHTVDGRLAKSQANATTVAVDRSVKFKLLLNRRRVFRLVGQALTDVDDVNGWVGASRLRGATRSGSESSR